MQGAGVQSLVRELSGMDKRKQTESKKKKSLAGLCGLVDVPGPLWTSAAPMVLFH